MFLASILGGMWTKSLLVLLIGTATFFCLKPPAFAAEPLIRFSQKAAPKLSSPKCQLYVKGMISGRIDTGSGGIMTFVQADEFHASIRHLIAGNPETLQNLQAAFTIAERKLVNDEIFSDLLQYFGRADGNLFVCFLSSECRFKPSSSTILTKVDPDKRVIPGAAFEAGPLMPSSAFHTVPFKDLAKLNIWRSSLQYAEKTFGRSFLPPKIIYVPLPPTSPGPNLPQETVKWATMFLHEFTHATDEILVRRWLFANFELRRVGLPTDYLFKKYVRTVDQKIQVDKDFLITFFESRGYYLSYKVTQAFLVNPAKDDASFKKNEVDGALANLDASIDWDHSYMDSKPTPETVLEIGLTWGRTMKDSIQRAKQYRESQQQKKAG